MLLVTLAEACKKTGWEVLAWGLMDGEQSRFRHGPDGHSLVSVITHSRCLVCGKRSKGCTLPIR